MKKSFENPAYEDQDLVIKNRKELDEAKKVAGVKSHQEASADILEYAGKTGDKKLEASAKENIVANYLGGKTESKELSGALNFEQLKSWWKEKGLDKFFNLEKQIDEQEKYWQKIYGADFKIDRSEITKDANLLKAIEKGLETGCVNGIVVNATPEKLSEEEAGMTEAQYAFHKLIEKSGMDIWAKTGTDRWTKLELKELLKRYLPVECSDFNVEDLEKDWVAEFKRVISAKGAVPKQKAGKIELIFTDLRQDIPADQELVNLDGKVVENPYSFIGAVSNKINFTTPEEEMIIAGQMYAKDKNYISPKYWERMMAIVDHSDKKTNPPVSAAHAHSRVDGLVLYSSNASYSHDSDRLRVRL